MKVIPLSKVLINSAFFLQNRYWIYSGWLSYVARCGTGIINFIVLSHPIYIITNNAGSLSAIARSHKIWFLCHIQWNIHSFVLPTLKLEVRWWWKMNMKSILILVAIHLQKFQWSLRKSIQTILPIAVLAWMMMMNIHVRVHVCDFSFVVWFYIVSFPTQVSALLRSDQSDSLPCSSPRSQRQPITKGEVCCCKWMIVDGEWWWWWLMVNDGWWWMMVDGEWWMLMVNVDGEWWWWMMMVNDVDGEWWWWMMLMVNDVDGEWWWWMMVDGEWWLMVNDDGEWWWWMMMV